MVDGLFLTPPKAQASIIQVHAIVVLGRNEEGRGEAYMLLWRQQRRG